MFRFGDLGISDPTSQMERLQLFLDFNTVPRIEAACLPVEESRDLDNTAWSICMWLGAVPEIIVSVTKGPTIFSQFAPYCKIRSTALLWPLTPMGNKLEFWGSISTY